MSIQLNSIENLGICSHHIFRLHSVWSILAFPFHWLCFENTARSDTQSYTPIFVKAIYPRSYSLCEKVEKFLTKSMVRFLHNSEDFIYDEFLLILFSFGDSLEDWYHDASKGFNTSLCYCNYYSKTNRMSSDFDIWDSRVQLLRCSPRFTEIFQFLPKQFHTNHSKMTHSGDLI